MMEELLAAYPELTIQEEKGIVVCTLSRHEMPNRLEVVQSYVEGRKFKTLKAEKDFDFQRLQPYIIPSQRRKKQLYCALTNRYINRKPAEVTLHLEGRRYKQALQKYNAGELSLFEEKVRKASKTQVAGKEAVGELMEVEEGEGEATGREGLKEEGTQEVDPVADGDTNTVYPTARKALQPRKRRHINTLRPTAFPKRPRSNARKRKGKTQS